MAKSWHCVIASSPCTACSFIRNRFSHPAARKFSQVCFARHRTDESRTHSDLDEFSELAKHGNVIPVFAEFIADHETPVSAFKKLDRGGYSFLFESTEKNDVSGRFSFVGIDPRIVIKTYGHECKSPNSESSGG